MLSNVKDFIDIIHISKQTIYLCDMDIPKAFDIDKPSILFENFCPPINKTFCKVAIKLCVTGELRDQVC